MIKVGIVEDIMEWPSKYKWPDGKPKPSNYTFKIGDGERYGIKGKPPAGMKAGDSIEFDANKNAKGYWEVDPSTIKPSMASPAAASQAAGAPKAPATVSRYGSPEVQNAISYQSARKDALELTKMLLDKDLIDFGKAKGAQRIELVEIYLDNYTMRFVEDTARLAPKPHGNPVEAEYGEDVAAGRKPVKRAAKAAVEPEDGALLSEEEDSPWN